MFSCPYHAWVFRPDGTLASVPHRKSYPADFSFDDPQNHMQRVGPRRDLSRVHIRQPVDNPSPLAEHLGPMTEVIDNLVDRAPEGEVEIAEFEFTIEYRGNWKLHLENAADIFHPSFVHSSSVTPARRAPANASILDQDQTREMLMANGFGYRNGRASSSTASPAATRYMTNIYSRGVLANQESDPVAARYKAALVERLGPERTAEVLGMNRFNNIIYPNLIINAQYQQMRVTIPISVDRTMVRIHCFRLKGAPDEMFHRAVRFLTTLGSPASMIFSDDVEMLERCQQGLARRRRPVGRFLARDRQRPPRPDGSCRALQAKCRCAIQFQAWVKYMTAEAA